MNTSRSFPALALSAALSMALIGAAVLTSLPAAAADAPAAAPVKKKAAKAPALPDLSPEQLANAERVLTGASACEFDQSVSVDAVKDKAGYFKVGYKGKSWVMAPEPTTTGAVRLEDKKNGLVWLQIANKSMLMNAKIGRRMVDNCVHPTQKT
ncbi:hypothetical protein [Sphaerotilus mobilis]|uniref:Uncharacterized protein n=1 Tax=Sphaerotilus mobilis TaxID=47994 RepID=A0A4Q7LS37_9BURK|nr:hypothetical protein [Sphaerotilus mobilis]RZS57243.1 hypothetical protein EV685_1811 [Sphaerotilus mobilis]